MVFSFLRLAEAGLASSSSLVVLPLAPSATAEALHERFLRRLPRPDPLLHIPQLQALRVLSGASWETIYGGSRMPGDPLRYSGRSAQRLPSPQSLK